MREQLLTFVKHKHRDQVRKYTGEPYHNHLIAVAEMADKYVYLGYEIGLCHDLLEDTDCTIEELENNLKTIGYNFMQIVAIIHSVIDLTDVYTHEAHPDKNRTVRKALEVERLATITPDSQTVKYCDLIDNTKTIVKYDRGFAKKYIKEKEAALYAMTKGDKNAYALAMDSLNDALAELYPINITPIKTKEGELN